MNILNKLNKSLKKRGVHGTIQFALQKLLGMNKYQEEIETLFYFLNKYGNIQEVPPAEGALRELQQCDIALLEIVDIVCLQYGLTYWLDYGTLLGAVRHKRFIPWDDDVDVAMPRADYNRAKELFQTKLGAYGIEAFEKPDEPMVRMGIGYKHKETGIWIDVFPVDNCTLKHTFAEEEKELREPILKYRRFYYKKRFQLSQPELQLQKEKFIGEYQQGTCAIWYHGPEFVYPRILIHSEHDIFPLKRGSFEGIDLCIPNHAEQYVEGIYGKHYMQFPHNGVEHHGSEDGKLAEWADKSHIDMTLIYTELKAIAQKIRAENLKNV